jgi:hypothetical protein
MTIAEMTTAQIARHGETRVSARRHGFYVGMAVAILAIVLTAFGQRYFLRLPSRTLALAAIVHVHAALFTSWILLFIAQTTLVAAHRVDIHRRLGILGALLAPAIVVLGVAVSIHGGRTGWKPGGAFRTPLEFMIVPLWDIAIFAVLVAAALYHRRRAELHRRLMLLATVGGLLWAAVTRVPPIRGKLPAMLGVMLLFVIASPLRDLVARRRPHPIDLWGGLLILVSVPLRTMIARTDAWHAFAGWLVR